MIEGCAPGFLGGLINAGGMMFMYGAVLASPYVIHLIWQKLQRLVFNPPP